MHLFVPFTRFINKIHCTVFTLLVNILHLLSYTREYNNEIGFDQMLHIVKHNLDVGKRHLWVVRSACKYLCFVVLKFQSVNICQTICL